MAASSPPHPVDAAAEEACGSLHHDAAVLLRRLHCPCPSPAQGRGGRLPSMDTVSLLDVLLHANAIHALSFWVLRAVVFELQHTTIGAEELLACCETLQHARDALDRQLCSLVIAPLLHSCLLFYVDVTAYDEAALQRDVAALLAPGGGPARYCDDAGDDDDNVDDDAEEAQHHTASESGATDRLGDGGDVLVTAVQQRRWHRERLGILAAPPPKSNVAVLLLSLCGALLTPRRARRRDDVPPPASAASSCPWLTPPPSPSSASAVGERWRTLAYHPRVMASLVRRGASSLTTACPRRSSPRGDGHALQLTRPHTHGAAQRQQQQQQRCTVSLLDGEDEAVRESAHPGTLRRGRPGTVAAAGPQRRLVDVCAAVSKRTRPERPHWSEPVDNVDDHLASDTQTPCEGLPPPQHPPAHLRSVAVRLPVEVQRLCLEYVTPRYVRTASFVCRRWHHLIRHAPVATALHHALHTSTAVTQAYTRFFQQEWGARSLPVSLLTPIHRLRAGVLLLGDDATERLQQDWRRCRRNRDVCGYTREHYRRCGGRHADTRGGEGGDVTEQPASGAAAPPLSVVLYVYYVLCVRSVADDLSATLATVLEAWAAELTWTDVWTNASATPRSPPPSGSSGRLRRESERQQKLVWSLLNQTSTASTAGDSEDVFEHLWSHWPAVQEVLAHSREPAPRRASMGEDEEGMGVWDDAQAAAHTGRSIAQQ
ncbi:F-box domain containing protein [Novymonas esmeraldas]|uniref:F-box domain containing protein n=1 Tax=Novymonas esmeraldas TaxID=1808958 RepID=A0AAW0EP90_9TRYP